MNAILRLSLLLLTMLMLPNSASAASSWRPGVWPEESHDFVQYWSAARIHMAGGNPYDGDAMLALQQSVHANKGHDRAMMLWTPPWTLPLYMPLGLVSHSTAHRWWFFVQMILCLVSVTLLWRGYHRVEPIPRVWLWLGIVLVMSMLYSPIWFLLFFGQNGGWMLLGVSGFLYCRVKGYPLAAGVFAALTAIKPHLLFLFGLALLYDVGSREGRRSLAAGVGTVIVGGLIALIPNPSIFHHYIESITHPSTQSTISVRDWELPLLSYNVREWLSNRYYPEIKIDGGTVAFFRVMFVPPLIATILFTIHRWRNRATWHWPNALPGLVLLSLLCAPYGAWPFDMVLLLVPWMHALSIAARTQAVVPITASVTILPINWLIYTMVHIMRDGVWFTPAMLIGWLVVMMLSRPYTEKESST